MLYTSTSTVSIIDTDHITNLWLDGMDSIHLTSSSQPFKLLLEVTHIMFKICRTIILPVVSYGCETLSLILREECRPRVFENRVLRRIFGPKSHKVTKEWRKLRTLPTPWSRVLEKLSGFS